MQTPNDIQEFANCLVAAQSRLYSYILTLLPMPDQANDVLQETNLVLWREASDFSHGTDFQAWARRVAYFQVLTHRRKSHRSRIVFGDAFLEGLARQSETSDDEKESVLLRDCVRALSAEEKQLIRKRYHTGKSVKVIADEQASSPNTIAVTLFRIRQSLMKCVQNKLAQHDRG